MTKKPIESRAYTFDVKSEKRAEGGALIAGQPIVYDSPTDIGGWFREIISRNALDGADMTDVPLFVNHNERMIPVARSRRNTPNSTLRLLPNSRGLGFEADLDTENNMTSRELNSAIERGDIFGMSFKFTVAAERWEGLDTDYPTRYIERFDRICEISAVNYPAYEETEIYSVRDKEALDNARAALENARGSAPVDTGNAIEILKLKTQLLTGGI